MRLSLGKASAMICLFLSRELVYLFGWLVGWLIFGRVIVQLVYKHAIPLAYDAESLNLPDFTFCRIRFNLICIIKKSEIT